MKKIELPMYNKKGGIFMSNVRLSKEWLRKKGEKLKTLYSYAVLHRYDIKSKEDVLKILKVIDPKNANEENAELFSKMLQLFKSKFRETIEENLKK